MSPNGTIIQKRQVHVRLQTLSFAELLNLSHLRGQSYLTKVYTCFSTRQAQPKAKFHMLTILTHLVIHHSSVSKLIRAQVAVF